jgi:thiol-disulfide isomerase/thioredoxin
MTVQKPPPRDFARRPWRFAATHESIRRVTLEGIPGTAMPAHRSALSSAEIEVVAAHVYRLATREPSFARERTPLTYALLDAGFTPSPASIHAPELPLVDADGHERLLSGEHGHVVLLHFWGATCEHCLQNMPKLQALADRWKSRGVSVLNVCADADGAAEAQQVVAPFSPQTRVWTDTSGLAIGRFDVHVLPTVWLIDSVGRQVAVAHGMLDWESPAVETVLDMLCQADAAEMRAVPLNSVP